MHHPTIPSRILHHPPSPTRSVVHGPSPPCWVSGWVPGLQRLVQGNVLCRPLTQVEEGSAGQPVTISPLHASMTRQGCWKMSSSVCVHADGSRSSRPVTSNSTAPPSVPDLGSRFLMPGDRLRKTRFPRWGPS